MIFPEVLDGRVMGFFTGREVGTEASMIIGRRVYFPVQKHTSTVITLERDLRPRVADAVITGRRDIALGVKVADCVPILMFAKSSRAIGAVHAGWRGTAGGILKNAVRKMCEGFRSEPEDLLIAMGPAIRWCCYQVGPDVLEAVVAATGEGDYHEVRDGRICLDLQSANKAQALSVGVPERNVGVVEECTYCHPEKYHSYRRTKGTTGRQGGFICMP